MFPTFYPSMQDSLMYSELCALQTKRPEDSSPVFRCSKQYAVPADFPDEVFQRFVTACSVFQQSVLIEFSRVSLQQAASSCRTSWSSSPVYRCRKHRLPTERPCQLPKNVLIKFSSVSLQQAASSNRMSWSSSLVFRCSKHRLPTERPGQVLYCFVAASSVLSEQNVFPNGATSRHDSHL